MAYCGVPTLTCLLLLMFLAALYAGVSSTGNDIDTDAEAEAEEEGQRMMVRVARSVRVSSKTRGTPSKKKDIRPVPSRATHGPSVTNVPPKNGKKFEKIGRGIDKKKRIKKKKHHTDEGERRPRPGSNKDGLPAGINRQMMRLAEKIHSASTPFAARLFQIMAAKSAGNIVMSPFSIHTALTMAMLGARGGTQSEMSVVLGHKDARLRKKKPHKGYRALLASLQNSNQSYQLYSANGIYVKQGIPLEDSFRQGLNGMYNASFDTIQMDYLPGPEVPINNWVSRVTRDKINQLVPAGSITSRTALIIVNAVYLNAHWRVPFHNSLTSPNNFYVLGGSVKKVDMMRNVGVFGYADHHDTEVIELMYEGDRLAMYILLPNIASNISQLQKSLVGLQNDGSNNVDKLLDNLGQEKFKLFLPRFEVKTETLRLKEPLQEMSMVNAFKERQADFSGISATGNLYIDAVLHKAFINVNEKGTEAAAATAVSWTFLSHVILPQTEKEVRVDRPFMFIIRDKELKEILFIGAYTGLEE